MNPARGWIHHRLHWPCPGGFFILYVPYNMINSIERHCLLCQKPVAGRSDKKFCDDYCRNTYNNQQKCRLTNYVRKVNNALLKNRKLLESLLPERTDKAKVHRDQLLDLGFQFRYHTHSIAHPKGRLYFYCYEYGYAAVEPQWYLIVRTMPAGD